MKFPWEKQKFKSIEIFSISELFPDIFSKGYFFIKKFSNDAIDAAKINDVVYCTCEYFTKTNTSDSWIVAPEYKAQNMKDIVSGHVYRMLFSLV